MKYIYCIMLFIFLISCQTLSTKNESVILGEMTTKNREFTENDKELLNKTFNKISYYNMAIEFVLSFKKNNNEIVNGTGLGFISMNEQFNFKTIESKDNKLMIINQLLNSTKYSKEFNERYTPTYATIFYNESKLSGEMRFFFHSKKSQFSLVNDNNEKIEGIIDKKNKTIDMNILGHSVKGKYSTSGSIYANTAKYDVIIDETHKVLCLRKMSVEKKTKINGQLLPQFKVTYTITGDIDFNDFLYLMILFIN